MGCEGEKRLDKGERKGLVWESKDNQVVQVRLEEHHFSCGIQVNHLGKVGI